MDALTAELAMERVERGLAELVPLIAEVRSETDDVRLLVAENALRACIRILRGEM